MVNTAAATTAAAVVAKAVGRRAGNGPAKWVEVVQVGRATARWMVKRRTRWRWLHGCPVFVKGLCPVTRQLQH